MAELAELIDAVVQAKEKALGFYTGNLAPEADAHIRIAIALLDQAQAHFELGDMAHARVLADRGRGR